jgi:lipopolysaccharide/colanic/teichoic acid biosynthesis glycosyltransferase
MDQSIAIDVEQWPQAFAPESLEASSDFAGDAYSWAAPLPGYDLNKRVLDVAIAVVVLAVLSPLWVAISLLIVLTSRGPVFHKGRVVGRGGRDFTWYKFRTMRVTDDAVHREWIQSFISSDAPFRPGVFKVTPDDRVTPVGRVLRRLSLDEIPQMFNVIRGEMSIVGPRPPMDYEFELYTEQQRRRLAVKPGITGLHQVTQRSRATFSAMVATDLDYITRRSLLLDAKIMALTISVMLAGSGAA